MRYFCSDMSNPSSWRETEETDERKIMEQYFLDHIKLSDADNSGIEEFYFAFENQRFFKLIYEWWIDDSSIHHETFLREIQRSEAKGICADRDWLRLS